MDFPETLKATMHEKARSFAAVLSLLPAAVSAQAVTIPTDVETSSDYYVWITQLSAGPIAWDGETDTGIAGSYYRMIVTTAEVYNDLFIEYMTLGEEGCCKRVATVWRAQVDAIAEAFGIQAEFNGLVIGKWRSHDTVELSIRERRFLARLESNGTLTLEAL